MPANRNDWGSVHLKNVNLANTGDFSVEAAVKMFPARTKQAFYAAIVRQGVIKRSTWNGCAFNAASMEKEFLTEKAQSLIADDGVRSFAAAAQAFGMSEAVVRRFISAWDSSGQRWKTDKKATEGLLTILEEVGLYTDYDMPKQVKHEKRIIVLEAYESTMTDAELTHELIVTAMSSPESFDDDFQNVLAQAELLIAGELVG